MFPLFAANISALQTLTHASLSSRNNDSDTSYLDPKPWSEIEKERDEAEIEREVDGIINELEKKEQAKMMYTQDEVEELLSTQRGNCYVAVLNQCRDEKIALAAVQAPEPGGDGWKKNKQQDNIQTEELDCPFDFTSRCTMGRCDCKPKKQDK